MSKETSPKTIETEDAVFTKDAVLATADIPGVGFHSAPIEDYHFEARFLTKGDLVEQLAWMHPDRAGDYWKRFRKETLVVVAVSTRRAALALN